jgi:hypothetical protein
MRSKLARFGIGAAAYLLLSVVWLYALVDRGRLEGGDLAVWSAIAVVELAHVVFGFAIREWPAMLLPIVAVFLAVPAGYPTSDYEPAPVWFAQAFLALIEIPCLALGLGLFSVTGHRRPRRAA